MTKDEFITKLNNHNDFADFDKIAKPLHPSPDICAMLLLHKLAPLPHGTDAIDWANQETVCINVDIEKLVEVVTDADVEILARCGLMFLSQYERFGFYTQ